MSLRLDTQPGIADVPAAMAVSERLGTQPPFLAEKLRPILRQNRPLRQHLKSVREAVLAENPEASQRKCFRSVTSFCRSIGQIPEKRIQAEFCKITTAIGCPDLTRVHDLRHVFATRAQESGVNPLLVQQITGHESLAMLARYTHLGADAKRSALHQLVAGMACIVEQSNAQNSDATKR